MADIANYTSIARTRLKKLIPRSFFTLKSKMELNRIGKVACESQPLATLRGLIWLPSLIRLFINKSWQRSTTKSACCRFLMNPAASIQATGARYIA